MAKFHTKHSFGRSKRVTKAKKIGRPAKKNASGPEDGACTAASPPASASQRKLNFFTGIKEALPNSPSLKSDSHFILAHTGQLQSVIHQLACPKCHGKSLDVLAPEDGRKGFAVRLTITCQKCAFTETTYSSPRIPEDDNPTRQPFEINRSIVLAGREVGLGHQEVTRMMAMMNVAGGLHQKSYHAINKKIMNSLVYGPATETLEESHRVVHQLYRDIYGEVEGPREITVSHDGTWHIKGHTSSIGVCFVIDCLSGLVLDYHVMSKYCAECELVGSRLDGLEKEEWMEAHRPTCDKNHFGSSGSMEVEGAKILWGRSVDIANFQYTGLVGDGDAAVFEALKALDPYDGIEIFKEECINHVAKRMFKGLERIVKEVGSQVKENKRQESGKALQTKLGGKGKMTQERMKKWSSYYRKAIVENAPNVEDARNSVWAILFHSISTIEDPHHSRCKEDWCWFLQATKEGKDPKQAFKEGKHDPPLPRDVAERLIPLFERLADQDLLRRCMQLQTSNANESLHSTVWRRAPKHKYCGKKTVETAVALAIIQFNKGARALTEVTDSLGLEASAILNRVADQRDKERIQRAEKAAKMESKTARKRNILTKVRQEEALRAAEGPLYEAGAF